MAAVSGATSLVELILKKWGDDIAGAAKELEEKVGFPESVANRIATGELPMDPESQAMRRGLFEDAEGFHGSTHDIKEFDGSLTNVDNDFGKGTYITDDAYDASANYAGEGADLTNRIDLTKEQIEDEIRAEIEAGNDLSRTLEYMRDVYGLDQHDMAKVRGWADESGLISYRGGKFMPDHPEFLDNEQSRNLLTGALTNTIARKQIKGSNHGVMYPVSVNHNGVVNSTDSISDSIEIKGFDDYLTEAAEDLETSYQGETVQSLLDPDGEYYDEVYDLATEMQYGDETSPNMIAYDVMRRYGLDEGHFELEHLDTWQDLRDVMDDHIRGGWHPTNDDGELLGSGAIMSEVMQELGLKGYNDMSSMSRFSGMEGGAGNHTIMFPGSENQIRSVNAAFDPEYKGSNIMGGLALPVAAGLLAAGQSEDADAGFITRGGKTLLEAWHGSPHKFDKFSMDQIGTGEGAQAYGHGLYFADSEDVARGYREDLNKLYSTEWTLGDERVPAWVVEAVENGRGDSVLADFNKRAAQADAMLADSATPQPHIVSGQRDEAERMISVVNRLQKGEKATPPGALYRTEIDVTPESLLDWDKPLSEQSEAVRSAIQDIASNGDARFSDKQIEVLNDYLQSSPDLVDGAAVTGILGDPIYGSGDKSLVSGALSDRGIKGIKYLDGDSRAAGNGTSNYVIFDDSLINIAERGNATAPMLGLLSGGSAAGAGFPAWSEYEGRKLPSFQEGIVAPLAGLLSAGEEIGKWAGDKVFEKTGSPALSTIPHLLSLLSPI